tara:strand:- start:87 stop:1049 length:963 start_codon:yes stop_codon:yes gene_type:complete
MKIITYNIQTDPFEGYNTFKLRLTNMCKYIKNKDSDIICLQEVATPETKEIIDNICKDKYYIIHSNHFKIKDIPKIAFLPAFLCFILMIYFKYKLLFILLITLIPYMTPYFLYPFHKIIRSFVKEEFDAQALCVLISKENFNNIEILKNKPFNVHGYEIGWPNLFHIPLNWFQITYLRPGFTLLSMNEINTGEKIIICNLHLATGLTRSNRFYQVKELISILINLKKKYNKFHIFMVGDFNTEDGFELDLIKQYMKNMTPNMITWDINNPRINDDRHEQLDYIWYKSHNYKDYIKEKTNILGVNQGLSDHYGILLECSKN